MATAVDYDPDMSVRAARARYFADNGFGDDGGYAAKWVTLIKLGPIPLGFPQTDGRRRAVRRHDLHHLVTGYDTDFAGEGEIAAWEIASDCSSSRAAVILNHLALALGLLLAPGRMRDAFARGCSATNLYHEEFRDDLLDQPLGRLRARLVPGDAIEVPAMTTTQRSRWLRTVMFAVAAQLVSLGVIVGLVAGLVFVVRAMGS